MAEKRTFVASSEIFSNFQKEISLYNVSSLEEIIQEFKTAMNEVFIEHNFTSLQKKLKETEFHIHGKTIEDILTSESEEIFFICDE
jgi:hypothetical protein